MTSFLRDNAPWLAAGFLISLLSSFGQTFFISVFAGEVRAEFALSHAQWGTIYMIATICSAAVMVWAGGLADRFRIRGYAVIVLCLLAGACLLMASAGTALALGLAIFALRFAGQGMMSHLSVVAMSRWFVATRGRALAIAALGFATGEALLPLGFVALKTVLPWRGLWMLAAGIALAAIPLLLVLLRRERTPQSMAETNTAAGLAGRHWTRGEVMRHGMFWLIVPLLVGPPAFITAFFFQQVHLAEVKGWPHVALVALFPLYTATSVTAMLASGWLVDRIGAARLMPLYQIPLAMAFLIVANTGALPVAQIGMIIFGVTVGMQATVPVSFLAEAYGTRHLGAIRAMVGAILVLGSALGPGLTGALIDAGVPYTWQLAGMAGWFLLASLLAAIVIRQGMRAAASEAVADPLP